MPVAGTPAEAHMPPELNQSIMHVALINGDLDIEGSDAGLMGSKMPNGGNIVLHCSSEEEIRSVWEKLLEGATLGMALDHTFWNAIYGDLTDKFGVHWSLNFQKGPIPGATAA